MWLSFSHYLHLSSFSPFSWSRLKRVPLALSCSLRRHMVSFPSLHRPRDSAFGTNGTAINIITWRPREYTALSTASESKFAVCTLGNVENNCSTYPTNNTSINDVEFFRIIKIDATLIVGASIFGRVMGLSVNYKESSYTDLRISNIERDEVWRRSNLSPYYIALIGFRLVLKPHPFTPFRPFVSTRASFRCRGLYISFSS